MLSHIESSFYQILKHVSKMTLAMVTSILSDWVIKEGKDISNKYTISIIIIFIFLSLFGFSCIFLKKQKTKPNKTKQMHPQNG